MVKEELLLKNFRLKDEFSELSEEYIEKVKEFLGEIIAFFKQKQNKKHLDELSGVYHFWCSYLQTNGVDIGDFPVGLALVVVGES